MVPYSAWEGQPESRARTELLQGKRSSCELSCLTWGTLILRSPEPSCRSSLLAGNSCPIKRTQEWARPRVILWFSFKSLLGATSHPTSGELGGVIQRRVRETRDDGWKLETKNNVWDAQSPGSTREWGPPPRAPRPGDLQAAADTTAREGWAAPRTTWARSPRGLSSSEACSSSSLSELHPLRDTDEKSQVWN